MAEKQASKNASKILVSIITVLAAPMILLCAVLFWEGWQKIRTLDNELIGLEIAKKVYPALTVADYKVPTEDVVQIQQLENSIGIGSTEGFNVHAKLDAIEKSVTADGQDPSAHEHEHQSGTEGKPSGSEPSVHDHESNLGAYLNEIAEKSGLILDDTPFAYYLSSALFHDLPTALLTVEKLAENEAEAHDNHKSEIAAFAHFHNLLGASVEALKALDANVDAANGTAGSKVALNQAIDFIKASLNSIEKVINAGGGGATPPASLRSPAKIQAILAARQIFADAKKIYAPTIALIQSDLEARRQTSLEKTLGVLIAAIISTAIALFLSAKLIRTTLVKLDAVESSHVAALRLSGELEAKISELQHANSEIIRMGRMEQLGQLTATVAHELRNPLGAVRTSAFVIKRKIEGKNVGIDAQISRIEAGILRCDNTITQLLDYSRSRKVERSNTSLDDWLVQVVTDEANRISTDIKIECSLGLGEMLVPVDVQRLQRLVTNLLSNAAEALLEKQQNTPPALAAPQIWISTRLQDDHAVIQVKDNGPGISEENLKRIREPLFTTKNFGTGLGIPAIEQIAAQHGGRLEISSVLGQGAVFEAWLPLQADSENMRAA